MDFTTLNFEIEGPKLIKLKKFTDSRGFFCERFKPSYWDAIGIDAPHFIQDNYSFSKANVLRGLHYQSNPAQGKLVTCLSGSILDVFVDIRAPSKTFGKHEKVTLCGDLPEWIWIPPGFAHGFLVTGQDNAAVLYKVTEPYNPASEGSILWSDPTLAIEWPTMQVELSPKDAAAQTFSQFCERNPFR